LQVLRAWRAFAQADFINSLPLPVPALYYQISGIIWALAGLALLIGLLGRQRWFQQALPIVTGVYLVTEWFDRLALGRQAQHTNTVFMIGVSLVLFGAVWFIRELPGVRDHFGEMYE